jgi:hypothetical protein
MPWLRTSSNSFCALSPNRDDACACATGGDAGAAAGVMTDTRRSSSRGPGGTATYLVRSRSLLEARAARAPGGRGWGSAAH